MNIFICTAQIITMPRLSFYKKKGLAYMVICLKNNKKRSLCYYAVATARGKLAHQIFSTYHIGDTVILYGHVTVKYKKVKTLYSNSVKRKKFITLKISKIYTIQKILN